MTTIVATRTEIGSDLQFTNEATGYKFKGRQKIFYFDSIPHMNVECPVLIGFAGSAEDVLTVADFYADPSMYQKGTKIGRIQGIALTAKQEMFTFASFRTWIEVRDPYFSIGSGSPYAIGAMAAGKTIKEAIKIAMKHDTFTGMGIQVKSFE